MERPCGYLELSQGRRSAVLREDCAGVPFDQMWADGTGLEAAAGRGGVTRLRLRCGDEELDVVARDYRRGGVLGRLLGDRHLDGERAARELAVTVDLLRRGVPVVEPIAALSEVRAGVWRLRLLTLTVVGAVPLPAFVAQHPQLRRAAVYRAGVVIDKAFSAGLLHRDLHPDNLIARCADDEGAGGDPVEVLLLDLDRAELRDPLPAADRDAMLLRMARYLWRHAGRVQASRTDRLRFLAGTGCNPAARRALIERLAPEFLKMVARHRLSPARTGDEG